MEFKFNFSEKDTQVIVNALAKEPYALVMETMNNLQQQASIQMAPKSVPEK